MFSVDMSASDAVSMEVILLPEKTFFIGRSRFVSRALKNSFLLDNMMFIAASSKQPIILIYIVKQDRVEAKMFALKC